MGKFRRGEDVIEAVPVRGKVTIYGRDHDSTSEPGDWLVVVRNDVRVVETIRDEVLRVGWTPVDEEAKALLILRHPQYVTFFTEAPWLHQHFLTNDIEANVQGYCEVEFCCHVCNRATLVLSVFPKVAPQDPDPRITALKAEFIVQHEQCGALGQFVGGHVFCPPMRAITATVDFRAPVSGGNS